MWWNKCILKQGHQPFYTQTKQSSIKDLKLVTMHVKSLHVRIPNNEAIACIKKKYDSRSIFKQSTFLPHAQDFISKIKVALLGRSKPICMLNILIWIWGIICVTSGM